MAPRGPLAGLRVLDFSWIVAGPTCSKLLADFGAEVIRVEYEARVDAMRTGEPAPGAAPGSVEAAGLFNNLNRNKLGVTINAVHPQGKELAQRLIALSDVVLENFRAHVMESWGLGYQEMTRIRPDIIYCSLSGFGHNGRDRGYGTWGPTAQAISGLTMMSGMPQLPPAGWGFSYMDHTAGYYAASAILMALHHRNQTGEGQYIDISQVETGMVLTGPATLDYTVNGRPYRRPGNPPGNHASHPAAAPHGVYPCQGEDRWIAIAVFNDTQWAALCRAMGNPAWAQEQRFSSIAQRFGHQDDLDRLLGEWTAQQEARALMHQLQAAGVPAGVVQNTRDRVEADEQLRTRAAYADLPHAELGPRLFEAPVPKLSQTPGALRHAAPLMGEHNDYVLRELLGLSDEEIAELAANAVFT